MEPRLEIKLPPEVVALLVDCVLPLASENELAIKPDLGLIEEDWRESWRQDLAALLRGDLEQFAERFGTAEFREAGVVRFADEDCEPLLRSCAALRLKLRDRELGAIADTALETGEVELARLNQREQAAMMCYIFLASLQEILIRHLDPPSARAEPEETDS